MDIACHRLVGDLSTVWSRGLSLSLSTVTSAFDRTVLDLTRGHLGKLADAGATNSRLVLEREATLFAWVEWRPANVPERVLWRGAGQVTAGVAAGGRMLGVFFESSSGAGSARADAPDVSGLANGSSGGSEAGGAQGDRRDGQGGGGVRFVGCGYNISVAGWQLVTVVRRARSVALQPGLQEQHRVDSTFFVNGYKVGSTEHTTHAASLDILQLGHGKMGPGFVGMAGLWAHALTEEQVEALWLTTRARFGLHRAQESRASHHTGRRRWTLAMSSTPEPFKDRGTLWYMAHMLQFVMRPNLHLQRLLLAAKRAVRWVSPSLGVHIRRGDACEKGHERLCAGAAALLPDIRKMYQMYGLRGVYLATDSASMVRDLKHQAPDMRWMVLGKLAPRVARSFCANRPPLRTHYTRHINSLLLLLLLLIPPLPLQACELTHMDRNPRQNAARSAHRLRRPAAPPPDAPWPL